MSRPALFGLIGLLFVALTVGVAVGRDDTSGQDIATDRLPPVEPSAATTTIASAPSTTERAASAITLSYTGGQLTRQECINLLNQGECQGQDYDDFDPLMVRCTTDGCTVTLFSTEALDGPIDVAGTSPHSDIAACGIVRWTLKLRPVGTAVTRGIEHPARLVGEATVDGDPRVVPEANCLGVKETYVYDAVPG